MVDDDVPGSLKSMGWCLVPVTVASLGGDISNGYMQVYSLI